MMCFLSEDDHKLVNDSENYESEKQSTIPFDLKSILSHSSNSLQSTQCMEVEVSLDIIPSSTIPQVDSAEPSNSYVCAEGASIPNQAGHGDCGKLVTKNVPLQIPSEELDSESIQEDYPLYCSTPNLGIFLSDGNLDSDLTQSPGSKVLNWDASSLAANGYSTSSIEVNMSHNRL